jgi:hypothetical protein
MDLNNLISNFVLTEEKESGEMFTNLIIINNGRGQRILKVEVSLYN